MAEMISHHDSCLTREVSSDQNIIDNHEYLEAQTLMLRSETHQQNREESPCDSLILINDKTSHYIYITQSHCMRLAIHIQGVKHWFSIDGSQVRSFGAIDHREKKQC